MSAYVLYVLQPKDGTWVMALDSETRTCRCLGTLERKGFRMLFLIVQGRLQRVEDSGKPSPWENTGLGNTHHTPQENWIEYRKQTAVLSGDHREATIGLTALSKHSPPPRSPPPRSPPPGRPSHQVVNVCLAHTPQHLTPIALRVFQPSLISYPSLKKKKNDFIYFMSTWQRDGPCEGLLSPLTGP